MTSLKLQKRLAASLLKVGMSKVKLNSENLSEIKDAITKSDIRKLIGKKIISIKKTNEQSRFRIRLNLIQKKKGRRQGIGSRKGRQTARLSAKSLWIAKIRTQRKLLKDLRNKKILTPEIYRDLYLKAKGGFFRSRRHLLFYLEEHNIIKNK